MDRIEREGREGEIYGKLIRQRETLHYCAVWEGGKPKLPKGRA